MKLYKTVKMEKYFPCQDQVYPSLIISFTDQRCLISSPKLANFKIKRPFPKHPVYNNIPIH